MKEIIHSAKKTKTAPTSTTHNKLIMMILIIALTATIPIIITTSYKLGNQNSQLSLPTSLLLLICRTIIPQTLTFRKYRYFNNRMLIYYRTSLCCLFYRSLPRRLPKLSTLYALIMIWCFHLKMYGFEIPMAISVGSNAHIIIQRIIPC